MKGIFLFWDAPTWNQLFNTKKHCILNCTPNISKCYLFNWKLVKNFEQMLIQKNIEATSYRNMLISCKKIKLYSTYLYQYVRFLHHCNLKQISKTFLYLLLPGIHCKKKNEKTKFKDSNAHEIICSVIWRELLEPI